MVDWAFFLKHCIVGKGYDCMPPNTEEPIHQGERYPRTNDLRECIESSGWRNPLPNRKGNEKNRVCALLTNFFVRISSLRVFVDRLVFRVRRPSPFDDTADLFLPLLVMLPHIESIFDAGSQFVSRCGGYILYRK
jgi:hypothetical protein